MGQLPTEIFPNCVQFMFSLENIPPGSLRTLKIRKQKVGPSALSGWVDIEKIEGPGEDLGSPANCLFVCEPRAALIILTFYQYK